MNTNKTPSILPSAMEKTLDHFPGLKRTLINYIEADDHVADRLYALTADPLIREQVATMILIYTDGAELKQIALNTALHGTQEDAIWHVHACQYLDTFYKELTEIEVAS